MSWCKIPETRYKIKQKSVKIECKDCGKLNQIDQISILQGYFNNLMKKYKQEKKERKKLEKMSHKINKDTTKEQ